MDNSSEQRSYTAPGKNGGASAQPGGAAYEPNGYGQRSNANPQQPVNNYSPRAFSESSLPPEYRPLSPWAYWGLSILYCIPVVGFIFLLIFTFSNGNIHRRNFTRSYWCSLLFVLIIGDAQMFVGQF